MRIYRLLLIESRTRLEAPMKLIHTAKMGKIKPQSYSGDNWFIIVFINDYLRYTQTYCAKHMSGLETFLNNYLKTTRDLIGINENVCFVRANKSTELTRGDFHEIMKQEKKDSNFTSEFTP